MRRLVLLALMIGLTGSSCGGASPGVPTSTTAATTTTVTTTVATTTTTAATTTTIPSTTTTVVGCDPSSVLTAADRAVGLGRLLPGVEWSTDVAGCVFTERTDAPEQFAADLALTCALSAMQEAGTEERLLLAAWTGDRMAYVIQSTDQPSSPYDTAVRFELIWERPWGEWLAQGEEEIWGVTMQGGETLIVAATDYPIGAVAKAWQGDYPEPPSPPPTIDAEAYAWEALEAAGAVNVGIAQPTDGTFGWLVFMTPLGNVMIATVGPTGSFDPMVSYLTGTETMHVIDGVDVRLTRPGADQHDAGNAGFACGPYGWDITATVGTAPELLEWLEVLVPSLECES